MSKLNIAYFQGVLILTCLAAINITSALGAASDIKAEKNKLKKSVEWGNVILVGTICSDDKKLNMAVIENRKTQAVYREGAILANGAVIKGIFTDHILIEKEKQTKMVKITGGTNSKKEKPVFDRFFFRKKGYQKIASDKFLLDPNKVFKSLKDISQLSVDVKTKKVADGFLIESTGGNELVDALGFKTGDVISKVNNHKFDSIYDAIEYIWEMENASSLNFEIARFGARKNIEIFPYQLRDYAVESKGNYRKEPQVKAKHEFVMNNVVYK